MGNADSIPIISQLKSLVQVISGDVEGARRTQENFRDTAPVVSQITSMVYAIEGKMDKARETQEKFAQSLDEMTDGLPIVGHIKGAVYYATGDRERGEETMKSATGSLVSMVGGAIGSLGGPAGAVAGAALGSAIFDGTVTGIDTAIHGTREDGSPQYYGTWGTYDRIGRGKASVGEIFDTVGMTALDAAAGAFGGKFARGKVPKARRGPKGRVTGRANQHTKHGKQGSSREIKGIDRCKRDVEYQLTPSEAEFVTSHQRLPGSVSEVMTANWQHLSVPQTVSNLVSLFIILRLILWNDKNGRTYSRELCTLTSETEYIDRCQDALRKTLRDMDNHLASQTEDPNSIFATDFYHLPGITNNSTIVMIRVMSTLYGILGTMGSGQTMGVKWLMELCIYEDLSNFRICEEEAIHKLQGLHNKASYLGKARKHRVKRVIKGTGCAATAPVGNPIRQRINPPNSNEYALPPLTNDVLDNIQSIDVGEHGKVVKYNKGKRGRYESNHVPASSTYGKPKPSINKLPAHSLPYDIHQLAMRKVGTSKSSTVAKTLRGYEAELIGLNRMDEAIKLDFIGSYGRSNIHVTEGKPPNLYRPALVEYRNDMHALINEHVKQQRIDLQQGKNLHSYVEQQILHWGNNKPTWDNWINHMESEYNKIVTNNKLTDPKNQNGINVPDADLDYG